MMNIQQLMKQAQQMQKKLQTVQQELAAKEFEGTASNGMVKVVMSGDGMAKSVSLADELIVPEDKDILQDLLVVAINDCRKKIDAESKDAMSGATGGLNLGGLF